MHIVTIAKCQPPSGGCVLKQVKKEQQRRKEQPAAFGRLCVETVLSAYRKGGKSPAAFGRLCVETYWFRRVSCIL